jgi:hypothetical protein
MGFFYDMHEMFVITHNLKLVEIIHLIKSAVSEMVDDIR